MADKSSTRARGGRLVSKGIVFRNCAGASAMRWLRSKRQSKFTMTNNVLKSGDDPIDCGDVLLVRGAWVAGTYHAFALILKLIYSVYTYADSMINRANRAGSDGSGAIRMFASTRL
jgi:hypothetical protein